MKCEFLTKRILILTGQGKNTQNYSHKIEGKTKQTGLTDLKKRKVYQSYRFLNFSKLRRIHNGVIYIV